MHDPSDSGKADFYESLRSSYKLSPAEVKLAQALLKHCDLVAAASERNISINTAKTHLKQIFEKTGCRKQSELIKLLLQL